MCQKDVEIIVDCNVDDALKYRLNEHLRRLLNDSSRPTCVPDIEQLLDDVLACWEALKTHECRIGLSKIVTWYEEFGQLLSLLSRDKWVLVTHGHYKKLLTCVAWFYRPNPKDAVERKVSQWALGLMREAITAGPLRNPTGCSVLPALPLDSFVRVFQDCLLTFVGGLESFDVERHLPWLVRTSTLLLQLPDQNLVLLELLVDVIPPSGLHNTGHFFDELDAKLSSRTADNWFPSHFVTKVAKKHPLILENKVVDLLEKWTESWSEDVPCDIDNFRWLILLIKKDDKMFQQLMRILHSALEKLNYHEAVLDLIQVLLHEIKRETSLFNLYPNNLLFLVYLLDTDSWCLPDESQVQHCVYILDALLGGVESGYLTVGNVKMLLTHFPTWYVENLRHIVHGSNDTVKSKVCLLVSLLTGDPILKVLHNITDYFE